MARNIWIGIMEDPTLKDVLKEINKAPGGNVPAPRPVKPGPILGGPREYKPGVLDPVSGARTRRDPAIELFRFYATGEEKPTRPIPPKAPDTKTVTVTDMGLTPEEKAYRQKLKESDFKNTKEKRDTKKAVREGTVGGMTRPIGSKPPLDLNIPGIAAKRNEQIFKNRLEAELIRDTIHKLFGVPDSGAYGLTPELNPTRIISREEQQYLDLLARRINDARLEAEASVQENLFARGIEIPFLERWKAMEEADKRSLEGRQAAERTRISRKKTEKSMKNLPEKITEVPGAKGLGGILPTFDFISMLLNANLMYKQALAQLSKQKREIY